MQNVIEMRRSTLRRAIAALPALLARLGLAGVVLSAPAIAAGQSDTSMHGSTTRTTYRVVNLGAGDSVGPAYINASGQVAYTLSAERFGPLRSYFYDGRTSRDIGTLGDDFARVTGLNDRGQIAGQSRTAAGQVRSFLWSRGRGMIEVGPLPGATGTWEPALNNHAELTGYSSGDPLPLPRAYRWTLAGGIEDLGGLAGGADTISYGRAINDAGLIAGNSLTPAYDYHAFAWTRATGMVDIDTLGNRYSDAVAVGARGQVAGNFFAPDNTGRIFIWTRAGGMRDIGTAGADGAWLVGMSAGGRMAGVVTGAVIYQRAITWTRESGVVLLGSLGGAQSSAFAANNKGQVVGGALTSVDTFHGFVWSAREGMVDLNTRLRHAPTGLTITTAYAISDNGAIVADSNAGLVLLVPNARCGCAHTVGPIAAPELVAVGTPFAASVAVASAARTDRHHVSWTWGDGSGPRGGNVSAGTASGNHVFTAPGMYTVSATVTDLAGNSVAVSRKVIAYAPGSSFAGGVGTFVSPHVANPHAPFQAGLAQFGFIAPAGTSARSAAAGRLHFRVGALNFWSTDLQPTGSAGQFAGTGAINGAGQYRVALATRSGSVALKIWRKDPRTGAQQVLYDSQGAGARALSSKLVSGAVVSSTAVSD